MESAQNTNVQCTSNNGTIALCTIAQLQLHNKAIAQCRSALKAEVRGDLYRRRVTAGSVGATFAHTLLVGATFAHTHMFAH